jgi:hypothetical protein
MKPIVLLLTDLVPMGAILGPHPCGWASDLDGPSDADQLALLTVNFTRGDCPETYVFSAPTHELAVFQAEMELRAQLIQEQANAPPPPRAGPSRSRKSMGDLTPALQDGDSAILTPAASVHLRSSLPRRFRRYSWHLLYRASRDGYSFTAVAGAVRQKDALLMVVMTRANDIIGLFANAGVALERHQVLHNGESFVFTCTPKFASYTWSRTTNFQFAMSPEEISVAGGGSAAIWIDDRFLHGFSEKCAAFNSPPLAALPQFEVAEIEMWHIGSRV